MNPPFSNGDEHLLHALNIQKNGGAIVCILNAETIKNPYTNRRKVLCQKLEELNADIQYYRDAFLSEDSMRKTNVEVAIVKVIVPETINSVLMDGLNKKDYGEEYAENLTDLAVDDIVVAGVKAYEKELELGISLIREYEAMKPYIMSSLDKNCKYPEPILNLKVGDNRELSINCYVKQVRSKYWTALFNNSKFTRGMTSNQLTEYRNKVSELVRYDFSVYNIRQIQIQMSQNMVKGIEDCIMKLFDDLSYNYSWYPETKKNIHYFNGWATNKAYMVNKKVILPLNSYDNIFQRTYFSYSVVQTLSDIEKVFSYLGAKAYGFYDVASALERATQNNQTKNVQSKYFDMTFYKKGTCHITFKDEEALKRFNIFGSRMRGWLPQYYGKKNYRDMTDEEKMVINEFEGEVSYEQVLNEPDKWLYNATVSLISMSA